MSGFVDMKICCFWNLGFGSLNYGLLVLFAFVIDGLVLIGMR